MNNVRISKISRIIDRIMRILQGFMIAFFPSVSGMARVFRRNLTKLCEVA